MKNKKHTPLLAALATLVVLLAGVVLIWLAKVRPDVGKGRSEIVTDFLRAELLQDGQTATQVFTYDKDILTIGLEFYLPGDQPCGALDVVLYDADTGEELSRSVGTMDYIVPDQYTTLGMDPAVTGQEGRRYKLAVTPHYATDAILAIGHSDGVALWKEQMAVDDRVIDGTMAMQITYQRIGGYLTRFFLLVGGLATVLAALAVWAVLSKKLALHRLVFVLVLGFGLLYSFVLPPYAAPDEKYHINQSFTLACRWANDLSHDEWQMGKVPTTTSFRRVGDEDADLQNENTTVFTWEAFTSQLFTTTDQPFDSHQEYNELQTDQNPLLYVVSAAAVFLAYVLHFGFAPALFLGRLANLLLFAALAALAAERGTSLHSRRELERLQVQMHTDRAGREALLERFRRSNEEAGQEMDIHRQKAEELRAGCRQLKEQLASLAAEKLELERRRTQQNQEMQRCNEEVLHTEREVARLEQQKNAAAMEEKNILDKLWERYELSHSEAQSQRMELESIPKATRRIGELNREIKSLGTPNIGAIEEFDRVNTRYTYLSEQRTDVEKAKEELTGVIDEITRQMTEIFAQQFRLLNESFQETFLELFGGGKARLELEDENDILGCGIEIKVQPPGKQLKTITLLSGGEKAFVAIALYFAIMKVHPTPFCVMDEIEAALDEANVVRYARYMRRIAGKTQFIVITHRRGTMEEADVLYGVTMQERGVSRILTINLNDMAKELKIK